jgi:antitoxin component of MazEF toxin-antitoxin module
MAFLEYRSARKLDALKWRETFQGTLAEAIALKKGTDVETEAKNLRRIELQRRQARNVKQMRGKMNNNRVNKLWYTEDDGTRVQCDTQTTMEHACFAENETHFSQTILLQ